MAKYPMIFVKRQTKINGHQKNINKIYKSYIGLNVFGLRLSESISNLFYFLNDEKIKQTFLFIFLPAPILQTKLSREKIS